MMILETLNLKKYFPIKKGIIFPRTIGEIKAVDGVTLSFEAGKTIALVGESGCGKTTVGKCIVRLLESTTGEIRFKGKDITRLNTRKLKPIRKEMQIIFQDPYGSLNPRMSVGKIVEEGLLVHKIGGNEAERGEIVKKNLSRVGIDPDLINRYPHEFSGGQRQRISIARALAINPSFIVCDEAVSALDVSVQAQILNLLKELQEEFFLTYLFITHNLAVVEYIADYVAVMYLGKIVEKSTAEALFANPLHPYTTALLEAIPSLNPEEEKKDFILRGDVPSPLNPPSGCAFHPRCPQLMPRCKLEEPPFFKSKEEHLVKCFLFA